MWSLTADRPGRSAAALGWLLMLGVLLAGWSIARAMTQGALSIERVQGNGWVAHGVSVEIDLTRRPFTARMQAAAVHLGPWYGQRTSMIRDIDLQCAQLQVQGTTIVCDDARINGVFPALGRQALRGEVRFTRPTRALAFKVDDVKVGGGIARVAVDWNNGTWAIAGRLHKTSIESLRSLLQGSLPAVLAFGGAGTLEGKVQLRGHGSRLLRAQWDLQASGLTMANGTGTLASDQLSLDSRGSLMRSPQRRSTDVWRFTATLRSQSGQGYLEPVFVDFGDHPLELTLDGDWWTADRRVVLRRFSVAQDQALAVSGNAALDLASGWKVRQLHADVDRAELPAAHALYLQPFLLSSALDSAAVQGTLRGTIDIRDNRPTQLALQVRDISAADAQRRWSLQGLSGAIHWYGDVASPPVTSQLRWQGAQLRGIEIGAGQIDFAVAGRDFSLLRPTQISVLDGSVELRQLRVAGVGQADVSLLLDAALRPISVQRLCAVFGWPSFGGSISGHLADLQVRNGVLTLGTILNADIFGGRVRVADLRLEELFGKWPRLSASIAIDAVDLEQVTSTFSFGRITGRLSGSINGLRLFNWSPVAFDAYLHTPPDDRSPHRISQRAVKNLGSLGGSAGGAAAALSRGLLRFFDDFGYERLGIRCKLDNEVCVMGGVMPAANGYYLVKGRGLPRIDVVGNATRVDWARLVKQLRAATQAQAAQANP